MSLSLARHSFSTFRDPAGAVQIRPDGAYRCVRPPYDSEILDFLGSPIAARMVADGRLIASEVLAGPTLDEPLLLRHPSVTFPSYPWEWSPAMWVAAAQLTLDVCGELVGEGWILKDATPLNVLFRGSRPVFVDVSSVSRANTSKPIWYAYGQFVRTFLLPLLAYAKLGWPLQASLLRHDGYEPEELHSALPRTTRMRQPALSLVTLPRMLSRFEGNSSAALSSRLVQDPAVWLTILRKTLSGLSVRLREVTPAASSSRWSDYAFTATHYSDEQHADKSEFVSQALAATRPIRVLDVGCNLGVYSALAADAGAEVVAIDTDIRTVDRLFLSLKESHTSILPLCVDLSRPTPAVGWENQESLSFLDRSADGFDLVMMLAVLHHLLVGSQIPLDRIARLCAAMTRRYLIVEWVPPTDPKFKQMIRGRENLYGHLNEESFRSAFCSIFRLLRERAIGNGRTLFLFEKA